MNRELVQAIARLLVADVRRSIGDPVSGVAPSGDARAIVGKLHAPIQPVDVSGASSRAVAANLRAVEAVPGVHSVHTAARPMRLAASPSRASAGDRPIPRGRGSAWPPEGDETTGSYGLGHRSGPASLVERPGPEGRRR
jgi:hypothetical protein